jgi:beta-fructofuranosidase
MTLRLPEHWLWDFWFAHAGDDVHVFYLQAPRSLGDPELRHRSATIGHAVSRDLCAWRVLPDALGPGEAGAFDDLATWTGSVLRHRGRWHLFYTGVSRAEDGLVQRVGLATSGDLVSWERQGLVVEADKRWYEKPGHGAGEEHWRDPWVECDQDSGRFHMLLTAHANWGPLDARGVIAHAWSSDLRSWEVGPPLSQPGEFHQLEVPQLVHIGGVWRIVFSATAGDHGAARLARTGIVAEWGTHYLTSRAKYGPYALETDQFLVGHPEGRYYAGRLIRHRGAWKFLGWRLRHVHGAFAGELSDPMPVAVGRDGSLSVVTGRASRDGGSTPPESIAPG